MIEIDCAFPGGNIVVESVENDEVLLHQELRDTPHNWFYWCFRVKGAAGRNVHFSFTQSRAIGGRGPALSLDGGETWKWLGAHVVDGNSFRYAFPADVNDARLSFAMPYLESNWQRFMAEVGSHPAVVQAALCLTPKGRKAEYVILRCEDDAPKHRVAITCRHHCCEMMANYVLEGLVRWVLQDQDAAWLRKNAEFFIVPFVDKDGVEDGDQGKGRAPRDHGRDYEGESIYPTTKAIRGKLPAWGNGCLHVGLDIHCPHISGGYTESIYLVGSSRDSVAAEQRLFSGLVEAATTGPLPFSAADFIPSGEAWNTAAIHGGGKGFSHWVAELPEVVLGTAMEVPYANVGGSEMNQNSARAFGIDLGKGLSAYLSNLNVKEATNRKHATP